MHDAERPSPMTALGQTQSFQPTFAKVRLSRERSLRPSQPSSTCWESDHNRKREQHNGHRSDSRITGRNTGAIRNDREEIAQRAEEQARRLASEGLACAYGRADARR